MSGAKKRMLAVVGGAIAFRFFALAVMTFLSMMAEAWPAPHLPDLIIDHVPYVWWIDRWNYAIWLAAYMVPTFYLLGTAPERASRFLFTCGLVSIIRGICIPLTGLGPVQHADLNIGMPIAERIHAWLDVMNPITVLADNTAGIYLTKDLFFSGHVATTFLLLLYAWPDRRIRFPVLAMHIVVVASVFLSHLHYSIDVIGAYALTFSVFVLREGHPQRAFSPVRLGPAWQDL